MLSDCRHQLRGPGNTDADLQPEHDRPGLVHQSDVMVSLTAEDTLVMIAPGRVALASINLSSHAVCTQALLPEAQLRWFEHYGQPPSGT